MARSAIFTLAIAAALFAGHLAQAPVGAAPGSPLVAAALQLDDLEAQFLVLLNEERVAAGLEPLAPYADLEDDAASQTADMIEVGDIYHSPDLAGVTSGWEALGENVGYGPTVDKLHTAFMNSPHHRDNIVGDYDRVGIAADRNGTGVIFVTFIFMRTDAVSGPSRAPASPDALGTMAGLVGGLWLGIR